MCIALITYISPVFTLQAVFAGAGRLEGAVKLLVVRGRAVIPPTAIRIDDTHTAKKFCINKCDNNLGPQTCTHIDTIGKLT